MRDPSGRTGEEGPTDPTSHPPSFEVELQARSYELDRFDHVNHAVFLNWLEHARFEAFARAGISLDGLTDRGLAIVVVRVEIDYEHEVRLADRIVVRTRAIGARKTSMTLSQEIVVAPEGNGAGDGPVAARARVVIVWLREGRPVRIPPDVREAFGVGGGVGGGVVGAVAGGGDPPEGDGEGG